jgi:hypothetical protein
VGLLVGVGERGKRDEGKREEDRDVMFALGVADEVDFLVHFLRSPSFLFIF